MSEAAVYAMSLPDLWEYALGLGLPIFIAFLTQRNWPGWAKSATMVFVVVVTTIIGDAITGKLNQPQGWREVFYSILVVFVLTVTTYRHIWKQFGVTQKIEDATSYKPRRSAEEE